MASLIPGNEYEERIALALLLRDLYKRALNEGKQRTADNLLEALSLLLNKPNRGNEK